MLSSSCTAWGRGPVDFRDQTTVQAFGARPCEHGGLFRFREEEPLMANHLTPEELSKELGIDRQEVIRVCLQEGVPIYQGKIDKTLFQAQLQALGQGAEAA
jgi:hypothetical protein